MNKAKGIKPSFEKEKGLQAWGKAYNPLFFPGGAEGDRTPDLMNAIHALSQLSYSPTRQVLENK